MAIEFKVIYHRRSGEDIIFHAGIMKDGDLMRSDKADASIFYRGNGLEDYTFRSLQDFKYVWELCWVYSKKTPADQHQTANCLFFAEMYQTYREEINQNWTQELRLEIEKQIEKLNSQIEKIKPLDDLKSTVDEAIQDDISEIERRIKLKREEVDTIKLKLDEIRALEYKILKIRESGSKVPASGLDLTQSIVMEK